jgi:hypothetical protein
MEPDKESKGKANTHKNGCYQPEGRTERLSGRRSQAFQARTTK